MHREHRQHARDNDSRLHSTKDRKCCGSGWPERAQQMPKEHSGCGAADSEAELQRDARGDESNSIRNNGHDGGHMRHEIE